MVETRQLAYFIAVAETRGFKAASERCCLSQSAISQQIKALEDKLGVQLFIRSAKSVELTDTGRELLPMAKKTVEMSCGCEELVKNANGELCGELKIGVGSFIEPYIRTAAKEMFRLYPNVRLNVIFNKAHYLNRLLCDHELDIAFTANRAYSSEDIESIPCVPFYLRAIMSSTHVLADREEVTFEELCQHQVILPDAGERVFSTIQKYLGTNFDLNRLQIKAIVNSPDAIINVLDDLNAITFMPAMYADHRADIVAKPIKELDKPVISNAHWLKDTHHKKIAQEFLRLVKEYSVPILSAY